MLHPCLLKRVSLLVYLRVCTQRNFQFDYHSIATRSVTAHRGFLLAACYIHSCSQTTASGWNKAFSFDATPIFPRRPMGHNKRSPTTPPDREPQTTHEKHDTEACPAQRRRALRNGGVACVAPAAIDSLCSNPSLADRVSAISVRPWSIFVGGQNPGDSALPPRLCLSRCSFSSSNKSLVDNVSPCCQTKAPLVANKSARARAC
jgi:hypothetical protein